MGIWDYETESLWLIWDYETESLWFPWVVPTGYLTSVNGFYADLTLPHYKWQKNNEASPTSAERPSS